MKISWTDRSRILEYQRCNRRRWLAYHEGGMGLAPRRTPLPLAVGSAVHAGLAVLLQAASLVPGSHNDPMAMSAFEQDAVNAALAELATHADGLELDLSERAAQGPVNDIEGQLKASLGQADDTFDDRVEDAKSRFDQYLWQEQSALVEGMVRAYARRRLRPLLEQYEVLEVEREGDWLLSEWPTNQNPIGSCPRCHMGDDTNGDGNCVVCARQTDAQVKESRAFIDYHKAQTQLRFASRPDALLRDRESNQLYIQSFKTAASWDIRKERDAERDMQGLSEGVEIERRLGEWWQRLQGKGPTNPINEVSMAALDIVQPFSDKLNHVMLAYLSKLDAPPRILGIRMEYLTKSDRWEDKDLSQKLGITARVQKSHLVRAYLNPGMTDADAQWNFSYSFHKEDGSTSKLYYKTWRPAPVWEHMPIKQWIDMLDAHVMTVGEENRELGYSGPGQASGFTEEHPLDAIFIPPIITYRREDELRDWMEQVESQEVKIAEAVEQVRAASDPAERRSLLNINFPMYRQSCEFPSHCPYIEICFGPDHVQADPMATGKYKVRSPNHIQEREAQHASQD
jgi:hypothetical protein